MGSVASGESVDGGGADVGCVGDGAVAGAGLAEFANVIADWGGVGPGVPLAVGDLAGSAAEAGWWGVVAGGGVVWGLGGGLPLGEDFGGEGGWGRKGGVLGRFFG